MTGVQTCALPIFKNYGFKINLDWDFAKKMIDSKVPESKQDKLNKLATQKFSMASLKPLQFYEDTVFVNMFELGMNGRWLNTDRYAIQSLLDNKNKKSLEYYTHNLDSTFDAYTLLGLFSLWADFSKALID